jgi:hypothetical protein
MYISGYFILLFHLTPGMAASEVHTSPVENANIRIEFALKEALKKAVPCLLYLQQDNSGLIDSLRTVTTDFWDGHNSDIVYVK